MKVFSPLLFDQPSFLSWDWPSGWGNTDWFRGRGLSFDRWREPSASYSEAPHKVREIPVQYEGAGRHEFQEPVYENYYNYDFSDDESDSDYDLDYDPYSYNWNNNGTRVKRKRRRSSSSKPRLISSKDSLLQESKEEPIEIDLCTESKVRKDDGKSSKAAHSSLNEPSQRVLRSHTKEFEKTINDTSSYEVYDYLKALLLSTDRQIDAIRGDGNCFFRALSKAVYGAQGFYDEIRQGVVDVMEKHPKRFEQFADEPIDQHIAKMRVDKTWATQTEIYAAATLLQRDIFILSPDQRKADLYRWLLFKPQFRYSSDFECCRCYFTLCHTHGNHYDRIAPLEGSCNCDLPPPEMSGVKGTVDLTVDENEIV